MSRAISRESGFLGLFAISILLATTLSPANVGAQADEPEPIDDEAAQLPEPSAIIEAAASDPIAEGLAALRLEHHEERRRFGVALLSAGLGSAVAGAITMGAGFEDPFSLGMGVGHLGWGVINAVAALFLMDLGEGGYRRIDADRALRGEALARARENAIREQHGRATVWAFNAGLDVLYIASGILLYFLGDQFDAPSDRDAMRGYSTAQIGQGGFLLAYDVVGWILAVIDADAAAAIAMPRW